MRKLGPILFTALVACSSACSEPRGAAAPSGKTPATGAPGQDVAPVQPAAPPQPPLPGSISEPDARALLSAWLDAQNAGRFDDYAKLYAERFEGVKRVGLRARRYDRAGWLADRRRMFGKPMVVKVEDVRVQTIAGGALVRFVQRWRSGTFEDVGPKELQLLSVAGGLVIARESMLASEVTRHDAHALLLADFMPVVHGTRSYAVLTRDADPAWGTGRPTLDSDPKSSFVVLRQSVTRQAVPEPIRAALPAEARGYHADGEACVAKVGPLFLLRRFFSNADTRDARLRMPAEVAAVDAWNEGAERTLLVASLDGPCDTALWARASDRPPPTLYVRQDASPELAERVLRAVRATAAYRNIEREYRATDVGGAPGAPARWEDAEQVSPSISRWRSEDRSYASYDISFGGCGGFGADLWIVFEERGEKLVPVNVPGAEDLPSAFGIEALFDADGDGALELLGLGFANPEHEANVFLHSAGGRLVFMSDVSPPFHDCGC